MWYNIIYMKNSDYLQFLDPLEFEKSTRDVSENVEHIANKNRRKIPKTVCCTLFLCFSKQFFLLFLFLQNCILFAVRCRVLFACRPRGPANRISSATQREMKGQKLEKAGGGQSNPTQPRTLLHTASMCVPGCLPSHSLFTLCPCPLINMGGPPAAHTLHVIGGLWTSSGFSARIKRTWPPSPLCASPPASLPIRRERFIL